MAFNTIQMASNFQKVLDQQMLVGSTTGFMEVNAGQVKYDGGDTVKIPTISMQGLGNYDRDNGYARGKVTLKYEDYKMTQDRGREFLLDSMDVNESNFVANAGNVMGEFQRAKVIPEVDAYRYSKIAALSKGASTATEGYTAAVDDILAKLDADIEKVQDIVGDELQMVICMATPVRTILNNAKGINKQLDVVDFVAGAINTKVKAYNGIPIIGVPSARMKSAYVFQDGKTGGQEDGGFKADVAAKGINWIVMARNAAVAVSKTDKVRIFTPDVYQGADAWKVDYRKYHDVWVPKHRLTSVVANLGA